MNKKAYISPELVVVQVETQSMIAASGEETFSINGNERTSGWADSRRGGGRIWDDDEVE